MEEISDGVKILCDRMESNPEDFQESEYDISTMERKLGKFYYEGMQVESLARGESAGKENFWYLNETEKAMLVKAYVDMKRRWATQRVVEKLLEQPEPEEPQPKKRVRNSILTTAAMQNASLALLNKSFDEAMAGPSYVKYKAKDRYATGFTAQEIGPVAELKKWATE